MDLDLNYQEMSAIDDTETGPTSMATENETQDSILGSPRSALDDTDFSYNEFESPVRFDQQQYSPTYSEENIEMHEVQPLTKLPAVCF